MGLDITTGAQRPELLDGLVQATTFDSGFPPFVLADPTGVFMFSPEGLRAFAEHVLVATQEDQPDRLVAVANTVPFRARRGTDEGSDEQPGELPDGGWDTVIRWGVFDRLHGYPPDTLAGLGVSLDPELQGRGLAATMVEAMREHCRSLGFARLVVPLRPPRKADEPDVPMTEYAQRLRADGLPADPWMRVHARLGATMVKVAPMAMVVAEPLTQWREWTGLPFDTTGKVRVPGALAPVLTDVEHDYAVYVEPNIWIQHELSSAPPPH